MLFLFPILAFADNCEVLLVEQSAGNAIVISTSGEKEVLKIEHTLGIGDSIATGQEAWVELRLCDGSILRVGENSKFKFEEAAIESQSLGSWAFELIKGSMLALVEGNTASDRVKLRVRTPSASVGVRGTEFLIETDEQDATSLHTIEGEVLMGPPESYEQLSRLKGAELAKNFESVPKEKMSRIVRGEKKAFKPVQFKLAELQKNRGAFVEKRLARLGRGEAVKRIATAKEKRGRRQEERQGPMNGKAPRAKEQKGSKPENRMLPNGGESKENKKIRKHEGARQESRPRGAAVRNAPQNRAVPSRQGIAPRRKAQ